MLDFNSLTLFLYIVMRMSGFVLMSPLLGRSTFPGLYKAGFVLVLSVATPLGLPGRGSDAADRAGICGEAAARIQRRGGVRCHYAVFFLHPRTGRGNRRHPNGHEHGADL